MVGLRVSCAGCQTCCILSRGLQVQVSGEVAGQTQLLDLDAALLQQHILARLPFRDLVTLWHVNRAFRSLVSP